MSSKEVFLALVLLFLIFLDLNELITGILKYRIFIVMAFLIMGLVLPITSILHLLIQTMLFYELP